MPARAKIKRGAPKGERPVDDYISFFAAGRLSPPQTNARTSAVLIDELDTGSFQCPSNRHVVRSGH
jgi:hypothetical protein